MVRNSRCLELSLRPFCLCAGSWVTWTLAFLVLKVPSWGFPWMYHIQTGTQYGSVCSSLLSTSHASALPIRLAGHPLLPTLVPQAHEVGFSRFRKVCMTRGNSDLMMYR